VTLGEGVICLLPRGTHDPDLFIKPSELREVLTWAGFEVSPMQGLVRGVSIGISTFGSGLTRSQTSCISVMLG
jgi:2-polyprenyl-3-methyl-5-hydroxy-6-metoxy-1,4-benzoquinol methylase